jgi:tRNA threonylcarbamoyladenosine biosynthesis protein TsaB
MSELLPILSIETSDDLCSTAVILDEKTYAEQNIKAKHVHSEKLVLMIQDTLKSVNLDIDKIKTIAISEGPGSFTGLRIGMAAAKGIAVGSNIPLIPVPTFEALAYKIGAYLNTNAEFAIIKNANRDEVYFSKYIKEKELIRNIYPLSLESKSEIENLISGKVQTFGDFSSYKNEFDFTIPNAIDIARWAYKFGKDLVTSDLDLLEPKYLKKFVVKERKR